ncbi:MAG TPA: NAD(+) kinase [Methylophilaceae bacterium]|nr:NAD(+) kinase [Methylophilaceae bacterium]
MQKEFNRIVIIGKFMQKAAVEQMQNDLADLAHHLYAKGIKVLFESDTAQYAGIDTYETVALDQLNGNVELAIVMGGDGTMLSVSRALISSNIPLVGINRGRFGFLTDLRAEEMLQSIDAILAGSYQKEDRMLLRASVYRNDKVILENHAFNDIVIKSGLRLIELEVVIDGNFVHKQRSDGLIVSTPTGTTAYSLSAGGPILHPALDAIALVPICPHTLSNRPFAVNNDSEIQVTLMQVDDAQISFDGQYQLALKLGDYVKVERANEAVTLLHPSGYCYYDMLRNKLHWG